MTNEATGVGGRIVSATETLLSSTSDHIIQMNGMLEAGWCFVWTSLGSPYWTDMRISKHLVAVGEQSCRKVVAGSL